MRALLTLSCLTLIACAAHAQAMKPGLWEIKQTPQLDAKAQAQLEQAQRQMAAMPADQRKMLEQMMAQQGVGINLSGGGLALKVCISKEQAERNAPPVTGKGQCSQDVQRSGNVINTRFACTDPASQGESVVTLKGDGNGFTSKTRVSTQRQGRSETVTVDGEAAWLGADCGTLKPQAMTASGQR